MRSPTRAKTGHISARIDLLFLGPPRVLRGAYEVRFTSRKETALLAFLAVTGRLHRRDTLATLLWPEQDEEHGRGQLRKALHHLRVALGPDLVLTRETARIEASARLRCDAGELEAALAECDRHAHGPSALCRSCLRILRKATGLWRDEFLAGFTLRDSLEFDNWQSAQTDKMRTLIERAYARLVAGLRQHGEMAGGVGGRAALDPPVAIGRGCARRAHGSPGKGGASGGRAPDV